MDNPNKRHQSSQSGKAGFFLRKLMKWREKKLDDVASQQDYSSIVSESLLDGHNAKFSTFEDKKVILSEKEMFEITKEWRRLGESGYANDEEMKILLLHTYREQARNLEKNIGIKEWGVFKENATKALVQVGFGEKETRDDLEKWRIIDLIDLNEQDRIDLEIHKYRQKSIEEGEKGKN